MKMRCIYYYVKKPEVNYNQCEGKLNQEKVWDNQCHPEIIDFNLLSSSKMGMNYAKGPFTMSMFYTRRCHSKWVHFQIPDTHIRHFDIGVPPPLPGPFYDPLRPGATYGSAILQNPPLIQHVNQTLSAFITILWAINSSAR